MTTAIRTPRTLRTDASHALEVDAGWHGRLAARRVTGLLDRGLAPGGLTSTQFGLLCLVAVADDDTLGALAHKAGLDQSTMSRNLELLAKAGWVEIAMVEGDRRRRAAWLTEAGAVRLAQAIPLWRAAHVKLVARLGVARAGHLIDAAGALEGAEPP